MQARKIFFVRLAPSFGLFMCFLSFQLFHNNCLPVACIIKLRSGKFWIETTTPDRDNYSSCLKVIVSGDR